MPRNPRFIAPVALTLLALVAGALTATPAGAQDASPCESQAWPDSVPRSDHSRLDTFTLEGHKVNVLLPPGYHQPGNARRYPVVYVLPGGGWSRESGPEIYLAYTDIEELTDRPPGVIVVMTYGGSTGFYNDWHDGTQAWESYTFGTLLPAIDARYRTLADRAHRAIVGESMGGYGAMVYAARHPDLFAAAGSLSGTLKLSWWVPGQEAAGTRFAHTFFSVFGAACGGDAGEGMFGDPAANLVQWRNHEPVVLAPNLRGVSLYVASGNGSPCDEADVAELTKVYSTLEPNMLGPSRDFAGALTSAGIPHAAEFPPCGIHSFRYFEAYLHRFWTQMLAAFGSRPPTSFDYRTVDAAFSVWGWSFSADPARAAEFLVVRRASHKGLVMRGSGVERVTTAGYFKPKQRVLVSDETGSRRVTADRNGSISFTVDLGPAHSNTQYTGESSADGESSPGYFVTRRVRLTPARKAIRDRGRHRLPAR